MSKSAFDEVKKLYEQTMAKLSGTPQLWQNFLSCVCHNYKLRFDEQVLLFAQRPNATAVATFDQWFKLYRPVKKGQIAIRVFENDNGSSKRYKRYYDISDTAELQRSLPVPIWNMKDEYQQTVAAALEQSFGQVNGRSFEEVIISSAQNIADENINSYNRSILLATDDSFLEDLGDDAVLNIYNQIVTNSIAYAMLSRLGYNAESYVDTEIFSEIVNFNTLDSLFELGKATQQLTAMGLSVTARAVKEYERNYKEVKRNESVPGYDARGKNQIQPGEVGKRRTTAYRTGDRRTAERVFQKENGDLVHTGSGNRYIRPESDNTGGRNQAGRNIHAFPGKIPQGGENGDVRRTAVLGDTEQAPQRTVGEMSREGGETRDGNRSEGRSDRRAEGEGLVGIRAAEGEHHRQSTRNNYDRDDFRLNDINQLSIFNELIEQNMIDYVLKCGSNEPHSLERIVAQFQKNKSTAENAEFLSNEFGIGGRGYIYADSDNNEKIYLSAWFNNDGIKLSIGISVHNSASAVNLSWEQVAERIGKLLEIGEYTSQNIIDCAADGEIKDIANKLWYLHQDCKVEYFIPEDMFQGGFPESTAKIKASLTDIKTLNKYINGLTNLVRQYETDRNVLRFHFHRPNKLLNRLKDLQLERRNFITISNFSFKPNYFITEDEKDNLILRKNENEKIRIAEYFNQEHTQNERIAFLKGQYGIGGSGRSGFDISYNSKGLTYKKGISILNPDCEVTLRWNEVEKRILRLISTNRYLIPYEKVTSHLKEENNIPQHAEIEENSTSAFLLPKNQNSEQLHLEFEPRSKINTSPNTEIAKEIDYTVSSDKRHNFRITDDKLGHGTQKEKFRANIAAIQLLKKCLKENRYANPDEQKILAEYVGWGGLSDAFDNAKPSWSYEYLELKTVLTEDEYNAARQSALTAFYTPPVVIKNIYEALNRMGFSKGNILEPSCGVGNFIGLLPQSMQSSKIYGVELDNISAAISAQLYQNAKITHSGFEETSYPDNFFDVVVGNIPFGDIQINDRRYNKYHFLIHDYFFAKSLDKVRPGGVIAFITSKGTMDKANPSVRKYIAQRAELLGAVRLPDNTFKANAGTEVTSDILFLQKRERMVDIEPDWVHLDIDDNGITMNSYFVEHPEMILGKMKMVSGPYGPVSTCSAIEGTELDALLKRAIANIHGKITVADISNEFSEENIETIPADPSVRNFSYTVIDSKVYFRENSVMVRQNLKSTAEKRIKALLPLRDCVRHLIDLQLQNYPDDVIEKEQARLNAIYDKFAANYGRVRSRANYVAFKEDCSYSLLSSLEKTDEDGNFAGKADIFTKRTISPHIPATHVEKSEDALALSLGEKACVDMEYMCQLTDKKEEEIYRDLSGSIFLNPLYRDGSFTENKYLPQDEYLSGNVREKLNIARLAAESNSAFNINVTALETVQPEELTAAEISVKLGTTWIDEKYIQQFMNETFNIPFWAEDRIKVGYSEYSGVWRIEGKSLYSNVKTTSVYGTQRISAFGILENSLNLKEVKSLDYFEDSEGKKHSKLNEKETQIAQEKQKQLRQAFQDWIWKDPERRESLTKLYNERFNSDRLREYDGSHLIFAGMNPEITLRPHQLNAIARIIYGGNSLLAHVVGAGKTFEMVAAAQESKRLGLCNKSLIVVPKHLTEQWGASYLQLYPAANILVARQDDFNSAERRKRFCSRIATGDYDAVIIGQTQFERLKMSVEYQKNHIEAEIEEITKGIQEAKSIGAANFTVKDLERTKKNLTVKLEKLNDQDKKDEGITFEELGIDRLFIDEAHYYKNLYMYTKMQNVKGINTTAAEKSSDMYMKVRYIDELTKGRGVIFATGTPISNSMVEMYTMQRYLQYQGLHSKGIHTFDAWAGTYGETVSDYELKPEGQGYQIVTRFAKFTNIPELLTQFKMIADIQTSEMLKLNVPEVERHNVVLQASVHQKSMIEGLAQRAQDFRDGKIKDSPQEMLLITNEGRKLALDQRIIDSLLPDYEQSKSTACAENIIKIYQETTDFKGTQLVFCDLSTPKKDGEFSVYYDLKQKLTEGGIHPEEIKFIHEANTDKAKDELFAKVRKGTVRVLIGSTQKMGAGTNVQDKLIALHHLDCPWTPANLEQREGRIIRQGNSNEKVHIFTYVTEGTFDAYMYQLLVRKQRFISQIMTGKTTARTCEDVDERSLNYSEIMAIATGNPMIKEAAELERDISVLTTLRTDFYRQKYGLEDDVNKHFPEEIARLERTISGLKHDITVAEQNPKPPNGFVGITVKGEYLSDKEAAGNALIDACKELQAADEDVEIGEYRGFSVMIYFNSFDKNHKIKLKSELTQTVDLGKDPIGNIQRIDNKLSSLSALLTKAEISLQDTKEQLETAKIECKKEFPREQELREKTERLNEIRAKLNVGKDEKESLTETITM